jgi:hypothetical protein
MGDHEACAALFERRSLEYSEKRIRFPEEVCFGSYPPSGSRKIRNSEYEAQSGHARRYWDMERPQGLPRHDGLRASPQKK